jgi:hypothetical protein
MRSLPLALLCSIASLGSGLFCSPAARPTLDGEATVRLARPHTTLEIRGRTDPFSNESASWSDLAEHAILEEDSDSEGEPEFTDLILVSTLRAISHGHWSTCLPSRVLVLTFSESRSTPLLC